MIKHAIHHIPDIPWAFGESYGTLRVRIKCATEDIKKITLYYKDRYTWGGPYLIEELNKEMSTELFEVFSGAMELPRGRFRYFFLLEDFKGETLIYDAGGFRPYAEEGFEYRAFQYAYLAEGDIYKGKSIMDDSIVYQIFPERFRNGNKDNDPENTLPWGGIPRQGNFFGGDLKGIREGIPYLKELGINMIYLTPIFLSSSNHKYNIKDYFSIDPQFGTLEEAKEMVKAAHDSGIKVIFDAVFNHTGHDFFAFEDIIKNGEKSEYKDWYHLNSLPIDLDNTNYYTFAEKITSMPKLRTENEKVRQYFFEVGKYWIREVGIDGWRLDVCDEVDHKFWQGFREACEEENKDSILIGEIMHEASSFLRGNELDSIMNYPFKHALTEYFASRIIDETQFINILEGTRMQYMTRIHNQLWNLIGSHDTPRFLTEAKGEINRLLLAVAFQFTWPGVPYIYYGDEVGVDGGHDPYCRCCMEWEEEKQDKRILSFYKNIIEFRKKHKEFNHLPIKIHHTKGLLLVERKSLEGDMILIFNNTDNKMTVDTNVDLLDITPCNMFGEKLYEVKLIGEVILEPMSFRILKKVK